MRTALVAGSLAVTTVLAFGLGTAYAQRAGAPQVIEGIETRIEKFGPPEIAAVASRVAPDSRGVIMRAAEDGHAQYIYNLRQTDSDLEMHEDWDDVFVVQGGTGKLEFANTNVNSKKLMAGEFRGGTLEGKPRFVKLEPNTVVRVPAGIPHIVRPTPGEKLTYLVVKIMHGAKKVRR